MGQRRAEPVCFVVHPKTNIIDDLCMVLQERQSDQLRLFWLRIFMSVCRLYILDIFSFEISEFLYHNLWQLGFIAKNNRDFF